MLLWESKVGQTYTVSIDKLENFANYDLSVESNYVTTTLAITPRQISVSTPSTITYDKAADGYHGGAYGKAHEAAVYFDYNVGSDSQNDEIDKNYRPVFKNLTYNTTSSVGQTAGKAPTKVGSYTVTIELNDANYTFASGNSKTLSFSVVKRSISEYGLMWNESVLLLQEGGDTKFTNFIANYVDDIMEVVTFSLLDGRRFYAVESRRSDDAEQLLFQRKRTALRVRRGQRNLHGSIQTQKYRCR